ncbi:MAG TPA: ABC transporter permease [Verrucomicrobia bacterium]|nr:ABC transporter permease [Verrucomicrobiota bacterium]
MNRSNPEAAIRESPLAELTIASMPMEEREEKLDETWALYEEIADTENVDERPDLLPEIEKLETMTAALYRQPEGLAGKVYQFRRCLGTDRQGRSIMVRAVYSIKVAILIGLVTSLISVIFGSILGASAAFFGGWVDHIVIWLYSTFSSIPNLVLLTVLVYMFTGSTFDGTLIPVYAAFCMTFWIGPCRLIRGEVLKIRELEYVQAATALGFNRFYILLKHILPNTAHLMFINFSLLFIGAIKSEVILSFLGLGVKKGPSWGIMINQAGQEVINGFFWQIGAATVFMFVLVLCFNILTDALQDAFDPKHV